MRLLCFDLETTSQFPTEARIVTAYLGVIEDDGSVSWGWDWLVRPDGYEIPEETTAIHGVTTEHALEHGVDGKTAIAQIGQVIREHTNTGLPVAGANLVYDFTVFDREVGRYWGGAPFDIAGIRVLDSLVLDKAIDKYRKGSRKLIDTAAHYGVVLTEEEAHGARADAIAAARIIQRLLTKPGLYGLPLGELHHRQVQWKREQAASFQEYLRTKAPADKRDPNAVIDGSWPLIHRASDEAAA